MGLFKGSGLKDAKMFERGAYLGVGKFQLEITKVLTKDTRKSGNGFIVEFTVVQTSDEKNHPVGSKATWFQSLLDKDVAWGAIKEWAYAVMGFKNTKEDTDRAKKELDPVIEDLCDEAIDKGALNGKRVNVETHMKKTGKDKDFTVHTWSPAS